LPKGIQYIYIQHDTAFKKFDDLKIYFRSSLYLSENAYR